MYTLHSLLLSCPSSSIRMSSFTLSYSYVDSDDVSDYFDVRDEAGLIAMFDGNPDHDTDIEHEFTPPFVARVVRLHPKSWQYRPAVTWSLMGCAHGVYFEISLCKVDGGTNSHPNSCCRM